jgi:hypothetical protein
MYLKLPSHEEHDPLLVGWSGPAELHVKDLEVTGGAISEAQRRAGFAFRTVGGRQHALDRLGVKGDIVDWRVLEDGSYAKAISEFDVGIIPLHPNPFNTAKSALKGLELCALGVPWIASPTEEYVALNRLGAGGLAFKPKDWRRMLLRLVGDRDLREGLRERGRMLAGRSTFEEHDHRWWDAWAEAWKLSKHRAAA